MSRRFLVIFSVIVLFTIMAGRLFGPSAWAPELSQQPAVIRSAGSDSAESVIRVFLVGDIMLDRGVRQSVDQFGQGQFEYIFSTWQLWRSDDVVFGNLEGPVSDQGADLGNLYSFRMSPAVLTVLNQAGFSVLSVANNHAGDWGRAAFVDTLNRLAQSDILAVGGGLTEAEARRPAILKIDDLTLGWLGFSDLGPSWLAVGATTPGILLANHPDRLEIIAEAAEQVDVLIVSYHFGREYQETADDRQRYLAQSSIDAGAKIIAGHHPHVIQEVIRYQDGLIAYSLGNFIFDQYFSEETMTGLILEVTLIDDQITSVRKHFSRQDDTYRPRLTETRDFNW